MTVPDSLDIVAMAELAVRALTSPLDPEDDYSLYWFVDFRTLPPVMTKEDWPNIAAKFQEALPLVRTMTGSDLNRAVDDFWATRLLKMQGPDHLFYMRSNPGEFRSLSGCGTGRLLGAAMNCALLTGDPSWRFLVEQAIDRLSALACVREDMAFFTLGNIPPDATAICDAPVPTGVWPVDGFNGRVIQPLGQFYAMTGYPKAKELGDTLVRYLVKASQYYGPDGEWLPDQLDPKTYPGREKDVHFGTHSHTLLYLLDYALATRNEDLLDFCRKSFEWALARNSSIEGQSQMATDIGFFIEYLNPHYQTCETCCVADMIAIGLKLSVSGVGDYWDQVDGWIRNQFSENQIKDSSWVQMLKP